jgi:cytochrome c oxidase assembly protein subunit 15
MAVRRISGTPLKINHLNWMARLVVALVFSLVFVGALVTSWQAGMAVPDWPLSFGSLNPDGWWADFMVRLEHGHRLLAALVGLTVGVLCAGVWGNWLALGAAFLLSVAASSIGRLLGAPPIVLAHLGVWPAAIGFLACLAVRGGFGSRVGSVERRLAVAAFVLVCSQATLGGLRVTQETAGAVSVATVLRIVHGCVAQAFLVVLVALAVRLAFWKNNASAGDAAAPAGLRRSVWAGVVAVYGQLILGASMRHLGAGLAIPTFPAADPSGSWIPQSHNLYTDLNFGHTRLGAFFVLLVVLWAAVTVLRSRFGSLGARFWARLGGVVVCLQALLGVLVILHQKPKTLATFHVVLGAALLSALTATLVHVSGFERPLREGGTL